MTANVLGGEKRRSGFLAWAAMLVLLPLSISNAFAQLRGHGGPVRALAIWSDGETAVSGSFDSTAIRWSLTRNAAVQVLRFHTDAVNAVVTLRDGRAATAGADGKIAIWSLGRAEPDSVLEGHTAPIAALAVSRAGRRGERWRSGSRHRSQDARSDANIGRPRAAGLVRRVYAGQPHPAHGRRR